VCSSAAAASRWVSREVEVFRELHPDRPILAALIEGNVQEGLPEPMRRVPQSGVPVEPLAADFHKSGDGEKAALLKLIAGIAGVGLDELVRRDAQRRLRSATAVTAGSVFAMLAMGAMTVLAFNARAEADHQRAEAEGLIEFMLTDLRGTLKGVGRLDAMTAVNERALQYYSDKDLTKLTPESLERRARIFHAMGEDDESRGDHKAALAKFREAHRTTEALLAAAPNNPDRIFEQAQSEFWLGYVRYAQARFGEARSSFEAYKRLADKLVTINQNNPTYVREQGYADGNICSIDLSPPKNAKHALQACLNALVEMERAAELTPSSGAFAEDIANRHAWLADAYLANGDHVRAREQRLAEEKILSQLQQNDPKNMRLKAQWIPNQRILAWFETQSGQTNLALTRLRRATAIADQLVTFDPSNKKWAKQRAYLVADIAEIRSQTVRRKLR
jgi:hypothetical protein